MTHRVLFLAGSLGSGGAERQLVLQATGLAARGIDVAVGCYTKGDRWEEPLRRAGIEVTPLPAGGRVGRMGSAVALARSHRPSVVQAAQAFVNLYAVAAARASGARSVGALRNSAAFTVEELGLFGRASLRAPDLLLANARAHVDEAVERFGVREDRVGFLPNAIDLDDFPVTDRSGHDRDVVRVALVGRLAAQKRPLDFVAALARARGPIEESGQRLEARIVGDGPERSAVAAAVAAVGLEDVCDLVGAATDVYAWYAWADILVLCSGWEGTPNVVLEAMATGLPVVVTPVGGVRDLVTHGVNGVVVPVGDVPALADALRTLVDPVRRIQLGRAGTEVGKRHGIDAVAGVLMDHYRSLIGEPTCAA